MQMQSVCEHESCADTSRLHHSDADVAVVMAMEDAFQHTTFLLKPHLDEMTSVSSSSKRNRELMQGAISEDFNGSLRLELIFTCFIC